MPLAHGREFEDVIEDLSDSCRRHRRFQDVAQQALLPAALLADVRRR